MKTYLVVQDIERLYSQFCSVLKGERHVDGVPVTPEESQELLNLLRTRRFPIEEIPALRTAARLIQALAWESSIGSFQTDPIPTDPMVVHDFRPFQNREDGVLSIYSTITLSRLIPAGTMPMLGRHSRVICVETPPERPIKTKTGLLQRALLHGRVEDPEKLACDLLKTLESLEEMINRESYVSNDPRVQVRDIQQMIDLVAQRHVSTFLTEPVL